MISVKSISVIPKDTVLKVGSWYSSVAVEALPANADTVNVKTNISEEEIILAPQTE